MKQRIWTAGLAGLLLAGMALAQTPARPGNKVVAVVHGVQIFQSELEGVLKAAEKAEPSPVPLPEAQRRRQQMAALGMMIETVLMRQFLEKYTRPVPPQEVERKLNEMRAGLKEQGKSVEEFCQETSQTIDQLKTSISEHLRWNAYAAQNVSEADVATYYKENKDFFDGVTVRVSHLVLRLPSNATDAERTKANATLEAIRVKLATDPNTDFAEMARQYSQDPMATKGGDLGWIPREFDDPFSKAAFALQVGQVSGVVQTDFGLHLIKTTDRKEGRPSDFAKIKQGVRELCAEDLRQRIMTKMRQDGLKEGHIKIDLP